MNKTKKSYSQAIYESFDYLLSNYPEVFVIGQGLWSPWYVGNTMSELEKKYGESRIIDTPVSESACTGAAIGASICGMKPIILHPRMDFMLYAMDPIINQAAKWSYMFGGQSNASVTIRGIINRGGEQGAQHSQALHSLFAHIPGLRVVMPSTVIDARDLFISSVLCDDPVLYIDDRWIYELEEEIPPIEIRDLDNQEPKVLIPGDKLTIVSCGYLTYLARKSLNLLKQKNITNEVELIDLRVLNPLNPQIIINSVKKTKNLIVIDGGWKNCGMAAEIIASVTEAIDPNILKSSPTRICLPDCPAPTPNILEEKYYLNEIDLAFSIEKILKI